MSSLKSVETKTARAVKTGQRRPLASIPALPIQATTPPASAPLEDDERRLVTETALEVACSATDPEVRRSALQQVVLANLGVARSLAAAHRDKGISREDLEQVAYTALVAAADRFRPEEDRDFLAFAVPTIRGELKRHFRDCGWTVRPPRRVQEIHLRVLAVRDRMAKEHDRAPSAAEIAAEIGEAVQHVEEALRLDGCFAPSSLDQTLGGGTTTLGDLLPEAEGREQEAAEARVMLGPAVRRLKARDREVLQMRFFDGLTQQEIGAELGVTQTQVSRILSRITSELRECLVPEQTSAAG